jgi:hypothetical protein
MTDKNLIVRDIKKHLGFKKDVDFAKYLGIKPNVLSNWKKRNAFDVDILITKCEFLNIEWLMTGEGSMLKSEGLQIANGIEPGCSKCREKETLINQLIGENNVLREQLNLPIPERNKKVS